MVIFAKGQRIILDDYFRRYVPKYLSVVRVINDQIKQVDSEVRNKPKNEVKQDTRRISPIKNIVSNKSNNFNKIDKVISGKSVNVISRGMGNGIVGKTGHVGQRATEFSVSKIKEDVIPISNNIGVGILSFNRLESLAGLITSIRKFTDLTRTTVFVSDESTDPKVWEWLKDQHDIICMHNDRIGIAGNTNRLLRCLDRFRFKLLLNDDVEVLKNGWDGFYFEKMAATNIKHFCYRQAGIYNATRPSPNNAGVISINEKPHGAVLAIHDDAFKKVGYMDESFGVYGYEHVDYSDRISRAGLAPNGYHDVAGSDQYFRIYNDKTSDDQKAEHFKKARELYGIIKNDKSRLYVYASNKSEVPSISYIIPFRDIGRSGCIETVVQNIKAQRFPVIQIIVSEQDDTEKMDKKKLVCTDYVFSKNETKGLQFNKSKAFNDGAFVARYNSIILHDADMLVRGNYTSMMYSLLEQNESVHAGATVCYMTKESTDRIISSYKINEDNIESDKIVSYYEGGSLGIRKDAYFRIGGFCELYVGYGVEDCDFFWKIKTATKMYNERSVNLFHLWHDRTSGWEACHAKNKQIGTSRTALGINQVIINDVHGLKRK